MPVDLSASIHAQYKRAQKRAEEAVQRGDLTSAALAQRQCAEFMRQYARYASDAGIRAQRLDRARAHDEAAERLAGLSRPPGASERSAEGPPQDDYQSAARALIHRSTVRWEDIGGLEATKREIKAAYGLSLARKPDGVELSGWRNILFYGPPGTGKTLLAAATSNGLEAAFFSVKVSDIVSKYFGESSKLISALYATARRLSPAVVFLDEFESVTPQRGSDDSGAERKMVSTLLPELDGMATKDSQAYVLTIAATNLPWLVDKAVLSRFEKKIYIPMPDEQAREAILRLQVEKRGHRSEVSYGELVRRTAGYSGREIEQFCTATISNMTQRANPDLVQQVDKGRKAVAGYRIRIQPLSEVDFETAFAQVQPATTAADLERYDQWRRKEEA
jgi:SpoVK/Ycf46/Vps4 family AAA+-type ATPase